jgi:tetratricopeptide (TPR) repeat protein
MYYARGTIYDKKGEVEKAAADYQKAIELDPETFDAYYNMGALYYNQGADYNNKANELPLDQTKKYDEYMKLSDEAFKKAIPYLEKANQLKPDDIATANTLIKLYTRTNQLDKAKELKAKYQ